MKLRQLNILGYQSVLVPWFGYMHLHRNDRLNYLRAKMNQCYSLSENKICWVMLFWPILFPRFLPFPSFNRQFKSEKITQFLEIVMF